MTGDVKVEKLKIQKFGSLNIVLCVFLFFCEDATDGLLTMWPMCGPGLFEFTEQIIPYVGLPNPALLMMCSEYELSVAKSGIFHSVM